MSLDLTGIVRRIEWLEKWAKGIGAALADLRGQIGSIQLNQAGLADRGTAGTTGEIVIVRPLAAIGAATFTEAVTGPPYVPASLVPVVGDCILWQDDNAGDPGEMFARRYVSRWNPTPEPGAYEDTEAIVEVDNFNPNESIPSTSRYIVCVRRPNGRLKAVVWDCGA